MLYWCTANYEYSIYLLKYSLYNLYLIQYRFRNVVLSAALFKKAGVQNRKRRNSDEDKTSHTSLESLSTIEKHPSVSNSKWNLFFSFYKDLQIFSNFFSQIS